MALILEVAVCDTCGREIVGVERVRSAHCYGCGGHVCLPCTKRIIWTENRDPVSGHGHAAADHRKDARKC